MRLIDADTRVTVQNFDPMNEEYNHTEMSVSEALDFTTDEGCPTIVDAIPIEWLREKMKWADDEGEMADVDCISWLIQTWQKEQEAQDG